MPGVANPLPTTAVVGHLTADQEKGLKVRFKLSLPPVSILCLSEPGLTLV